MTATTNFITFGNVPVPEIAIRDVPDQISLGVRPWDDTGQRVPQFVVLTRLMASLDGADGWMRSGDATTLIDYGVDREVRRIIRRNDPEGRRSGYT